MVVDRRIHVVKRNIDKITGDNVNIGHRFRQQNFNALKGAVNIGSINNSHG